MKFDEWLEEVKFCVSMICGEVDAALFNPSNWIEYYHDGCEPKEAAEDMTSCF